MRRLAILVGLVLGTWSLSVAQNSDTAEVIVVENKSDIDDIEFINRRFRIDNFSQDRIIHVKTKKEEEEPVAEAEKKPEKSNVQPRVQTISSSSSSGGGGGSYSSSSSVSKKKKRKRNRKRIRLKKKKKKRMGKRAACPKF